MHKLTDLPDLDEPVAVAWHLAPNRQARRAEAAAKARPLPKSIWKITALRDGTHHFMPRRFTASRSSAVASPTS